MESLGALLPILMIRKIVVHGRRDQAQLSQRIRFAAPSINKALGMLSECDGSAELFGIVMGSCSEAKRRTRHWLLRFHAQYSSSSSPDSNNLGKPPIGSLRLPVVYFRIKRRELHALEFRQEYFCITPNNHRDIHMHNPVSNPVYKVS